VTWRACSDISLSPLRQVFGLPMVLLGGALMVVLYLLWLPIALGEGRSIARRDGDSALRRVLGPVALMNAGSGVEAPPGVEGTVRWWLRTDVPWAWGTSSPFGDPSDPGQGAAVRVRDLPLPVAGLEGRAHGRGHHPHRNRLRGEPRTEAVVGL
jgi:hypothetical protein